MRIVAIVAIITALAVPALAQGGDPSKTEANKAEERKKKESDEVERAYQDMLKRTTHGQPAKKTGPWDPWRNSR
jgi:ribosomal protein L12E/L44/L45/RPP1/RPP2